MTSTDRKPNRRDRMLTFVLYAVVTLLVMEAVRMVAYA